MNEEVDIPPTAAAFILAVNGGDQEAFRASFAPEAVVDDWGTRYEGWAAIKRWSDRELLGAQGHFEVASCTLEGDSVSLVGDWTSTFANGRSLFRLQMSNDAIAVLTIRGA